MHPLVHATKTPDKIACIMGSDGGSLTYRQLDDHSNQGAHLFRSLGLERGDVIATLMSNGLELFSVAWAAQRAGLYLTSISTRLSESDVAYILADSGAKLLVSTDDLVDLAQAASRRLGGGVETFGITRGTRKWSEETAEQSAAPIDDESPGTDMLYSSGTTGRPKGVRPPLPTGPLVAPTPLTAMGQSLYGMHTDCVYLSTSPLYHAAPLRWAMTVQRLGGTVIVMDHFDAETALRLIERCGVTHSTWVPTHFVRMLKLPESVRDVYRHDSMEAVIHAAAPCPIPVKRAMIDWWGPIVHEYYSGTEMCGITALSSEEWLRKPGSVGRAVLGNVKILDDEGVELLVGSVGNVYFADGPQFEYHNDPEKTRQAYNSRGWATLGDIGRLDEDGYLYLTDRKSFKIISGGVNIYPQEIENLLVTHPKIYDVAVIGAPDDDLGEKVIAVVQPSKGVIPDSALVEELRSFVHQALGGVKTPKQFDFRSDLPRELTGKLMKRRLADEYRNSAT